MKTLLLTSFLCLSFAMGASAEELTEAVVAQSIIKDQGYRMFRFEPVAAEPRQVVICFKGHDTPLDVPASKQYIVTVKMEEHNSVLRSVRVDAAGGATMSMTFPDKAFGTFRSSISSSTVVENDSFLTLNGPDGELQIVITPRTDG